MSIQPDDKMSIQPPPPVPSTRPGSIENVQYLYLRTVWSIDGIMGGRGIFKGRIERNG